MASNSKTLNSDHSTAYPFKLTITATASGASISATAKIENTVNSAGWSGGSSELSIEVEGTELNSLTVSSLNPNTNTKASKTVNGSCTVSESGTYTITAVWTRSGNSYAPKSATVSTTVVCTVSGGGGGGGDEPDVPIGITLASITTSTPSVVIGQTCKYKLENTDVYPETYYYWYYVELYLGSYRVYYDVFRESSSGLTSEKTINLPDTLMSQISATSTYGTGYLKVETYLGNSREPDYDRLQGSNQVGITFNTTNYGLTTGTVSVNTASTPIANTYIQNKTTLNISWANLAPSLGANLTLLELVYGDMIKTYKNSAIQTTGSFITIPIVNSGNVSVFVRITDSRGYTIESAKTTLSVLEYQFPQPTMTVERYNGNYPDSKGNTIKSLIDWTYTTLSGRNSITLKKLYITPINEEQWVEKISSVSKNVLQTLPGTYSQSQSYQVKFVIEDTVGSHVEKIVAIGTEPVIMDLFHTGEGLAFGKVSEAPGLEISYPTKFQHEKTYGEIGDIIWFGDPGKEYGLKIDDEDVIVYFNGESFNLYDTFTDFERRIRALEERG